MTDLQERLEAIEGRLEAMEVRESRAPKGLAGVWREVFPPEVRAHMRAARKEQLLAARAFLDHWIDRMEARPVDDLPRRESIELE